MSDFNVRQESIRILEENIGSNLFDISQSNFFQDISPKAKKNKSENEIWGLHQDQKETVNKTKRQPTEWEKIFANDSTDRRLISRIYKELLKPNTHKTDNHIKKWVEDMNRHFSNEK